METPGERLDLPYELRFTCQRCGDCCRTRVVPLSLEEKERLEGLGLSKASPRLAGRPLFETSSNGSRSSAPLFHLARLEGGCVLLEDDNSCLVHNLHGQEAKPLACRQFPLLFIKGPDGVMVSASFACTSVVGETGELLRQQEQEIRPLAEEVVALLGNSPKTQRGELFQLPERILLSAAIGLDWLSYKALDRTLVGILEDETHTLAVRLLAMNTLVSGAVAEYGRGFKATPAFADWMEHMNSGHGQRWVYQEAASGKASAIGKRRVVLAPLISYAESRCAAQLGIRRQGDGIAGTAALARGRGRCLLPSLSAQLDLESVDRVKVDQDLPELRSLLVRYLGECIRRKTLLRHSNLLKGIQHLLVRHALVKWYAAAVAARRGRETASAEELREAVQIVERYYDPGFAPRETLTRQPSPFLMGLLLDVVASPIDLVACSY